jgi:NAD(P)-dependent dehydrogenase (short-subunit alcohol dehydrogenase family)
MQDFEGKTAVITGGASGIGLALAEKFAAARMNVVLADIQQDALDTAVEQLKQRQANVIGVNTDTMLRASIDNLLAETVEAFGKVHILCNNAGVFGTKYVGLPAWEVPDVDWDWVMGVNFNGVRYGIQTFVPHMLAHDEPCHIVNTASLAALIPGGGNYGVSKHAVLAFTEGLQRDLIAHDTNIRASVLCPGFVDTQIFAAERNRPSDLDGADVAETPRAFNGSAMTAIGKRPAEVANIVFESIEQNRFYVLPHTSWDDLVLGRVQKVLARGEVATFDMELLQRRREAGEDV